MRRKREHAPARGADMYATAGCDHIITVRGGA